MMYDIGRARLALALAVAALASLSGCGEELKTKVEREALARQAAPSVTSFQAKGEYREVDGEPAVGLDLLAGPGDGAVQVLPGRSRPGARERQCTSLGVRLVPFGKRGSELLPIVADGFEAAFDTRCGIP